MWIESLSDLCYHVLGSNHVMVSSLSKVSRFWHGLLRFKLVPPANAVFALYKGGPSLEQLTVSSVVRWPNGYIFLKAPCWSVQLLCPRSCSWESWTSSIYVINHYMFTSASSVLSMVTNKNVYCQYNLGNGMELVSMSFVISDNLFCWFIRKDGFLEHVFRHAVMFYVTSDMVWDENAANLVQPTQILMGCID